MPNNVTHRVFIRGPLNDLQRMMEIMIREDPQMPGTLHFDFNQVIPLPATAISDTAWGTKDNSHNLIVFYNSGEYAELLFDTAWRSPIPVFEALAKKYPTLTFDVAAYDEGELFACRGSFQGDKSTYRCGHPTDELREMVFGAYPSSQKRAPTR